MSWKSIKYSLLAVILTAGLLVGDAFLFGIETVLGIVGIVVLLIVPGVLLRKAKNNAAGLIDKLFAFLIAPALIVIVGFFTIMGIVVWN